MLILIEWTIIPIPYVKSIYDFLLDTNICIYIIKNSYVDLVKKLRTVGIEQVGISTITIAELEFRVANKQRATWGVPVQAVLAPCSVHNLGFRHTCRPLQRQNPEGTEGYGTTHRSGVA